MEITRLYQTVSKEPPSKIGTKRLNYLKDRARALLGNIKNWGQGHILLVKTSKGDIYINNLSLEEFNMISPSLLDPNIKILEIQEIQCQGLAKLLILA